MKERRIAYFSMEIALDAAIPTYAGGLGVLAGDTIRSAADASVPMVAVSLLAREGYFYQRLDEEGHQTEEPVVWSLDDYLEECPERVQLTLEGREVHVRAWRYDVLGQSGEVVPVYLLDTDLAENDERDRMLTHWLYGGDDRYRLRQEAVLGIGGVRMLRELCCEDLERYHMNEGHSSLLTLELLDEHAERAGRDEITEQDVESVRRRCVFTTHTPVPAGHDQFETSLVAEVLGRRDLHQMKDVFFRKGALNMTYLALNLSHYINGVAKRHGLVSRHIFGEFVVDAITNGVHVSTWTSPAFQRLFDRHIPSWKDDNFSLRSALGIPTEEVWAAHREQKRELIREVNREENLGMDVDVLTIGYARRMTAYKRPMLILEDIERLEAIAREAGGLQLVFAGKAHPKDDGGKEVIREIHETAETLPDPINLAYLENYDVTMAGLLTAGVDIWLNTPQPPMEASGTSGMKAALNGVPSLSVLDGWWVEGCIEGLTGWGFGDESYDFDEEVRDGEDSDNLYDKLENEVVPLFCNDREEFIDIMRHAIALNGSFFNTQRMLQQYVLRAYLL